MRGEGTPGAPWFSSQSYLLLLQDTYLQDAATFGAALNILTGPEHAQCHAVQHDDQHADVLEPPAGCVLRAVQ